LTAEVPLRTKAVSEGGPDQHGTTLAPTSNSNFKQQNKTSDRDPAARYPSCASALSLEKQRAQGKPGVYDSPTASRAKYLKHMSIVTTGSPKQSGLSCAMVLTVSFVLPDDPTGKSRVWRMTAQGAGKGSHLRELEELR
jgi:hypothetical protein